MKKRGRSLTRDVHKINELQSELDIEKRNNNDLHREIGTLRDQRTRAINVLGIAGECLASRGALETARFCRVTAGELTPYTGMSIGANEDSERR